MAALTKGGPVKILMFYHTLVSDWNHGNAHFLRGIASELITRGHDVSIFEPADSWSYQNLISEHGEGPLKDFARMYPELSSVRYESHLDFESELDGADIVLVHEW